MEGFQCRPLCLKSSIRGVNGLSSSSFLHVCTCVCVCRGCFVHTCAFAYVVYAFAFVVQVQVCVRVHGTSVPLEASSPLGSAVSRTWEACSASVTHHTDKQNQTSPLGLPKGKQKDKRYLFGY